MALNDAGIFSTFDAAPTILFLLAALVIFLYLFSITNRRLHDVGEDPWLNPKNAFWLPGQKEENKYGKPPEPKIDIKALLGL